MICSDGPDPDSWYKVYVYLRNCDDISYGLSCRDLMSMPIASQGTAADSKQHVTLVWI